MALELKMAPDRAGLHHEDTGIYVRAKNKEGRWDNADIAELDKESLLKWLASRDDNGPNTKWRDDVILILLGHHRD